MSKEKLYVAKGQTKKSSAKAGLKATMYNANSKNSKVRVDTAILMNKKADSRVKNDVATKGSNKPTMRTKKKGCK